MRLFVFGLGYSACAFADTMHEEAAWIGGTTRSSDKVGGLAGRGFEAFPFDGTAPGEGIGDAVAAATHLLVSVAPGDVGDPVLAHYRDAIAAAPDLAWIGYLSTVGIYGHYGGAWVGERTTPHPRAKRSVLRLETERAWSALAAERGTNLAVFRVAGIYGPARNTFVKLADGTARRLVKPGQVFNRIHVDDIGATLAAASRQTAAGTFNLADDEPAPPQDVVSYAARLMGIEPPPEVPFETAELSPMARSFYGENKRVSNRRIKADLGVALRYPTYREGLSALWSEGTWRGPQAGR